MSAGARRCHVLADAILFDLDGVLVDSTASVERLWRAFALRHHLDTAALLHDLHGRRMVDIVAAALPGLEGRSLAEEVRRVDAEEVEEAHATVPLPGALELTSELTGRRLPWAIATSGTTAVASARLGAVGLPRPPVLVTADDVRSGKPAPDPYLLAAAGLGVDPTRCLVIEDAPSGVRAGNAAGATTVAVSTSHRADQLRHAVHQVGDVADLHVSGGPRSIEARFACRRHVTGS